MIDWSRESGARHIRCDLAAPRKPQSRTRDVEAGESEIYRDTREFAVGDVVRTRGSDAWMVVTLCGSRRISEGEDDTRVGETRHWAYVRAATDDEASAAAACAAAKEATKAAAAAALTSITTGVPQGRDWRAPVGSKVIARRPAGASLAPQPSLVACGAEVYHVAPVYDDDPVVTRLSLSPEQAQTAAQLARWTVIGGAA